MNRRMLAIAGSVALACVALQTQAQTRDLNVVSWGGAYQDGQKEVYFKPFNATGTKLTDEAWDGGLGVLRTNEPTLFAQHGVVGIMHIEDFPQNRLALFVGVGYLGVIGLTLDRKTSTVVMPVGDGVGDVGELQGQIKLAIERYAWRWSHFAKASGRRFGSLRPGMRQ